MRLLQVAGLLLCTMFTMASAASAEPKILYFAHMGGPGSLVDISVNEFARRVNEKLPSDYKVVPAGSSQMGNDTVVMDKLRSGEVAFGLPSGYMSAASPKFSVFELPFLIRSREQVRKLSDALLEPFLQPEAKKINLRILAVWENGFRQFTNNVRPIKRPADLKGVRIRRPPGDWWDKLFRTLGADPVPMDLKDVREALKVGKIDAQDTPLAQVYGSKIYEVQRYLTLTDHLYTPAYVVVGEEHFSKMPPEVQKILTDAAMDLRTWIFNSAARLESDLLDKLSEKMEVNQADLKAFRTASLPLYAEFARNIPGGFKLIETISALAEGADTEIVAPK